MRSRDLLCNLAEATVDTVTKLSVNLNKIALVRNRRSNGRPSVAHAAQVALDSGADGITVHPRPDQRHITTRDVVELARFMKTSDSGIEFNVEGYPTDEFLGLIEAVKPDQVTLVPDAPMQLTSDHGWNVETDALLLQNSLRRIKQAGARSSLFADPEPNCIDQFAAIGADRIELYTGEYASDFGSAREADTAAKFAISARRAQELGLGVNAGHDLNRENLPAFLAIPGILEVSIGHYLMCDAITMGLSAAVRAYKEIVARP
jgi:pyridoxine 5-phosphate synthase